MIPISDLRKGNLIKTEYGILPIHDIVFNDVQVVGTDGRILWANEVEGVELTDSIMHGFEFELFPWGWVKPRFRITPFHFSYKSDNGCCNLKFAHELQNLYYWIERKEEAQTNPQGAVAGLTQDVVNAGVGGNQQVVNTMYNATKAA